MLPSYRYSIRLLRVIDGDTIEVDIDLGLYVHSVTRLRLLGVNCPEMNTEAGREAKRFVEGLLAASEGLLTATTHKPDKYGNRWNATVWLPSGESLNDVLIKSGHAVPYSQ